MTAACRSIRDLTVAAPLKQTPGGARVPPRLFAIRDLTVAAPLKLAVGHSVAASARGGSLSAT